MRRSSNHIDRNERRGGTSPRPRSLRRQQRHGVASVLAMMFLVIFSSLAAAMAVVAQANMRTADSAKRVSRAMSAAETGMVFAQRRLAEQSARFVITKGVIDDTFGEKLWMGTYVNGGANGTVTVLDPQGFIETTPPDGIIDAMVNVHNADSHTITVAGEVNEPTINEDFGYLLIPPIALTTDGAAGPYFKLKYELLSGEPSIRITSEGVDGSVTRALKMDMRLSKKIEFAILSPNRIMIGKNVRIEGPLGSRYGLVAGELDPEHGDPIVLRSDFYYLDAALDAKLDVYFGQVIDYDVDGDDRLRPNHNVEQDGLGAAAYLIDYDGNEYVDDFDIFLGHYDGNNDYMVVYDAVLAAAAGHGSVAEEFAAIDDQLARLIDESVPDRDGDGAVTASDVGLGYKDGVLDVNDLYAKVDGRLAFAVAQSDWESAHGSSYQTVVNGPVVPEIDVAPAQFDVSDEDMLEITTSMFDDSYTWFNAKATGNLTTQAVAQDGVDDAVYTPVDPNTTLYESVPYDAPGAYDHYQRPKYEYMTFTNVRIPEGTNALFEHCTFVGVTFIQTETDNDHHDWNYAGALTLIDDEYELQFPGLPAQDDIDDGEIVADTRTISNNIRFHNCTILGSVSGDKPLEYAHWRNKIQFTGETRFYINSSDPDLLDQDDAATLAGLLDSMAAADIAEMEKSSILMPGWSVDVGNFTNDQAADPEDTPKVKLKGTIIAGILDVRGTAEVFGTLLMTFRPAEGVGPLYYGGLPDVFNTTIGYFDDESGGMEGGDLADIIAQGFGEIRLRYDPNAKLPDGVPWPVSMEVEAGTYVEGSAQ